MMNNPSNPFLLKIKVLALFLLITGLFFRCGHPEAQGSKNRKGEIEPLKKHWEKPIPYQKIPEGLESLSASECGDCHEEIYREWLASNHAIAFQDLQFQAEWAKDDSLWVCLNCHTPLQNQQEFIILGKRKGDYFQPVKKVNPHFDSELQRESITCAVCHVRDGFVTGIHGNQEEAPHEVKAEPDLLSRELCLSCHNITDVLTPTLVCSFQSGEEWSASPYPKAGRDCISCHMPPIYRPLTSDGIVRQTRRHTWVGSAIPKITGGDKVVEGYQSGLEVVLQTTPEHPFANDSMFLTVTITNQRAGHYIPTGDPEYYLTVDIRLADELESTIKDTTFRIGQEWEWWPEAKKLSDNRLRPLEQRIYTFASEVPSTPGVFYWEVMLTSHRMTVENATLMKLLGKYPIEAIIYHERVVKKIKNEKGD